MLTVKEQGMLADAIDEMTNRIAVEKSRIFCKEAD
jgi:hypothetical protein